VPLWVEEFAKETLTVSADNVRAGLLRLDVERSAYTALTISQMTDRRLQLRSAWFFLSRRIGGECKSTLST
jgi:hypothetical protein